MTRNMKGSWKGAVLAHLTQTEHGVWMPVHAATFAKYSWFTIPKKPKRNELEAPKKPQG